MFLIFRLEGFDTIFYSGSLFSMLLLILGVICCIKSFNFELISPDYM